MIVRDTVVKFSVWIKTQTNMQHPIEVKRGRKIQLKILLLQIIFFFFIILSCTNKQIHILKYLNKYWIVICTL